ncbi:unnamed protein product [Penicillium roqueforti FM164]|uniref:Genomic scaffold, ProqFM164S03 n=1 Tax=Penicillium roqueforti (strain FM164) TaxID=1365484 RepID=W6QHL1_PENRF|nr:unnamed protein product [Penicillium roqueforti FM164]
MIGPWVGDRRLPGVIALGGMIRCVSMISAQSGSLGAQWSISGSRSPDETKS